MKEPTTALEIHKAMKSLEEQQDGSKKLHVLKTEIETFRMSEGKDKKNDLYCETEAGSLECLHAMVNKAIENAGGVDSPNGVKFKFRTVPLDQFGKTMDDVFLAFVKWAAVGAEEEESPCKIYNVSKTYRRLISYAEWMEDSGGDDLVLSEPLTAESVKETWNKWKMNLSYDSQDRLIWWWDISALNVEECKHISYKDSLRLFVWLSHFILFDAKAQANGMVFVCDFCHVGFWATMTMFPMKLGLALDRLTIGVLPIRMEAFYLLNEPVWCKVLFGMMKPFMSKKMRKRLIVLKSENHETLVEHMGGTEFVPRGFSNCQGTLTLDIIIETYFLSEPT